MHVDKPRKSDKIKGKMFTSSLHFIHLSACWTICKIPKRGKFCLSIECPKTKNSQLLAAKTPDLLTRGSALDLAGGSASDLRYRLAVHSSHVSPQILISGAVYTLEYYLLNV